MSRTATSQLEVDLNIPLKKLQDAFAGNERAVDRAVARAIRKTVNWIKRQLRREVALQANIPQKNLKHRVKSTIMRKANLGIVWLGLNPVGAHLVGKPRQTRKGTRVGRKHFFEGAFFKRIYTKHEKIYRRKFRGPGSSRRGRGDGKFPVEVMLIQLEAIGEDVARNLKQEAEFRFHRTLRQEMNYALNVENQR